MSPRFDAGRAFVRGGFPRMQVAAVETSPDFFFVTEKSPAGDDIFSKLPKELLMVFFRHADRIQGVGSPLKPLFPGYRSKSFIHTVMDVEL